MRGGRDGENVRGATSMLLAFVDMAYEAFATTDAFLGGYDERREGCIDLDLCAHW